MNGRYIKNKLSSICGVGLKSTAKILFILMICGLSAGEAHERISKETYENLILPGGYQEREGNYIKAILFYKKASKLVDTKKAKKRIQEKFIAPIRHKAKAQLKKAIKDAKILVKNADASHQRLEEKVMSVERALKMLNKIPDGYDGEVDKLKSAVKRKISKLTKKNNH